MSASLPAFLLERIEANDGDPKILEAVAGILHCVEKLDEKLVPGGNGWYGLTSYTYGILEELGELWSDHPDYESWFE